MKAKIDIGAPGYVGGSMAAEVLGYSTFGTPYDAWLKFMGKAPEPDEETKKRFEMGHQLEDFIAKQIERVYKVKLRKCNYAYVNEEHPWSICHPDRIATTKDGVTFPVEIKSASAYSAKKWGAEDSDEIPYGYLIQCYDYFHCGVPNPGYMWQVTFADNQLKRYIIHRDEAIEEAIFSRLNDIIENQWLNGFPPSPSNYDEAKAIWFGSTDGAIEADEAIAKKVERIDEIKEQIKNLEAEKDSLQTKVVDFMQDKSTLMHMGVKLATYKKQSKTSFDSARFKSEHEALFNQYQKTTEYMVLRT